MMSIICLIIFSIHTWGVITLASKKKVININGTHNQWITKGINISCKQKKELLSLCRHSNDLDLKIYYKCYCSVLSKVILAAKNLNYSKITLSSRNKMKCTWKIIVEEKGAKNNTSDIQSIMIDNKVLTNHNKIAKYSQLLLSINSRFN